MLPEDWRRHIELCSDLLATLDVVDPGTSRNRGKILKDLIPPYMKLAEHGLKTGQISKEEFEIRKRACSKFAKDLIQCFKYEIF